MPNQKEFQELSNAGNAHLLKYSLKDFKSIKEVKVYQKKVKAKWWIFPIKKEVTVVRFVVDESLYVVDCLLDDNPRLSERIHDDEELEIIYV